MSVSQSHRLLGEILLISRADPARSECDYQQFLNILSIADLLGSNGKMVNLSEYFWRTGPGLTKCWRTPSGAKSANPSNEDSDALLQFTLSVFPPFRVVAVFFACRSFIIETRTEPSVRQHVVVDPKDSGIGGRYLARDYWHRCGRPWDEESDLSW